MTDNEMCLTFKHFLRLGVEETMPDQFSIGPLVEAQMYAARYPERFSMESLRDVIHYIQDKHPAWWQQYLNDVRRYAEAGLIQPTAGSTPVCGSWTAAEVRRVAVTVCHADTVELADGRSVPAASLYSSRQEAEAAAKTGAIGAR